MRHPTSVPCPVCRAPRGERCRPNCPLPAKPGRCPGVYYNDLGKRFVRCSVCRDKDYEANEGDRCRAAGGTARARRPKLSRGHLCLSADGSTEFFERGGNVYRAPIHNAIDVDGYRLGRWECSRTHFDRYRGVIAPGVRS